MSEATRKRLRRYRSLPGLEQSHPSGNSTRTHSNRSNTQLRNEKLGGPNSMLDFANALCSPTLTSNTSTFSPIAAHDVDYQKLSSRPPDSSIYKRQYSAKTANSLESTTPSSPLCHYQHTYDPNVSIQRIVVGIYSTTEASEGMETDSEATNTSEIDSPVDMLKLDLSPGHTVLRSRSSLPARARTMIKSVLRRSATTGNS